MLFVESDNTKTGLPRDNIVLALKSKKAYSKVLITDACAELIQAGEQAKERVPAERSDLLYKMCAALPQGKFVDLNTCSSGQIAAISSKAGSAASSAFLATFRDGKNTFKDGNITWKVFEPVWQEKTNGVFKSIKQLALGANPNDKHYSVQDSQDFHRFDS
jgi:hypothetical protein